MKRYFDYSHEELATFDDDQVNLLIELEIAHEGIKPVEIPIKPDLESAGIVRDVKVYEVGGLIFKNREDAEQSIKMDLLKSDYDYNIGYDYKWVNPITDIQISEAFYYKQEDIVRVKDALAEIERKRKDYESAKSIYDKFLEETGKIRSKVWDMVTEARDFEKDVKLAKATYDKHLILAEQDENIAAKFFRDAYQDDPDIIERVLKA